MVKNRKYVFITIGLVLVAIMPVICLAGSDMKNTEATEKVGGAIPVIRKVFVSGEGYPNFFPEITGKDYQAGFRATDEGKVILTVMANAPWKVSVRGEFKPVGEYIKPASDLLIKIKNKAVSKEGLRSGTVFNKVFVNFGPLNDEEQMLWINKTGGNHQAEARIDYKVLLSIVRDIPGKYSVVVTYTISAP